MFPPTCERGRGENAHDLGRDGGYVVELAEIDALEYLLLVEAGRLVDLVGWRLLLLVVDDLTVHILLLFVLLLLVLILLLLVLVLILLPVCILVLHDALYMFNVQIYDGKW